MSKEKGRALSEIFCSGEGDRDHLRAGLRCRDVIQQSGNQIWGRLSEVTCTSEQREREPRTDSPLCFLLDWLDFGSRTAGLDWTRIEAVAIWLLTDSLHLSPNECRPHFDQVSSSQLSLSSLAHAKLTHRCSFTR